MLRHAWGPLTAVGLAACTPPNPAGAQLAAPTTGEAFKGVSCSALRPPSEPDLMGWDAGSRSNLNRLRRQGVVAVRYRANGCDIDLEVLSNCIGTGTKYEFSPYSANEHKVARNAGELFAKLPIGAARLSGALTGDRELRTDYMLAGQYSLTAGSSFDAHDLRGPDCARATHVVSAVYVGAFAMAAGESRAIEASASLFVASAGGSEKAHIEVIADEGDPATCKTSQRDGKESASCSVPLRIGLMALSNANDAPPSPGPGPAPPSPSPTPAPAFEPPGPRPQGHGWQGIWRGIESDPNWNNGMPSQVVVRLDETPAAGAAGWSRCFWGGESGKNKACTWRATGPTVTINVEGGGWSTRTGTRRGDVVEGDAFSAARGNTRWQFRMSWLERVDARTEPTWF